MSRPPTLLLACGGYRSGSTLAYNLLGELVERALAGARLGYVEPEQVDLLAGPAWSFVAALGVAVGKAHHSPAIPEGGRWEALLDGRLRPVCTVRDWRDVLHSFTRVYDQGPEQVLSSRRWRINLDNVRWWRDAGARLVRYEQLVTEPRRLLADVGRDLGLPPDERLLCAAVRAATGPPAGGTEAAAGPPTAEGASPASFAEEVSHPRTLLHAAHVERPEGGGWRSWPADQRARVEERLAPLQAEFGYPVDATGPPPG